MEAEKQPKSDRMTARRCLVIGAVLYVAGIVLPPFRYEDAPDTINKSAMDAAAVIELGAAVFAATAFAIVRERKGPFNAGLLLLAVVLSTLFTLNGMR